MQAAWIEGQQVKETEREQAHGKERQRENERGREWEPEPSHEPKRDEQMLAVWIERK
jgi:hypothetical protein